VRPFLSTYIYKRARYTVTVMLAYLLIAALVVIYVFRDNIRQKYADYAIGMEINGQRNQLDMLGKQLTAKENAMDAQCKLDPTSCVVTAHLTMIMTGLTASKATVANILNDLTSTAKQFAAGPAITDDPDAFRSNIRSQLALLRTRVTSATTDVNTATSAV